VPTPEAQVQSAGFLLELSPDWLILRASENTHSFLGEYHQRLVGEPLGSFMLAQSLHDLRNSLSRQRSSNGIARAYRVRLIDEPRHFDIAFQALDGSILLEGLPCAESGFGEWLGSVSRLIEGLRSGSRKSMLDGAARRMRALTGFDHVTLSVGEDEVESSRGKLAAPSIAGELPAIVADSSAEPVRLFPRNNEGLKDALLRAPTAKQLEELRTAGVRSALRVPVVRDGEALGHFQCHNRAVRPPSFEQHAAAELFAQMFGMLLPN
jgi:light-regulated signal transduction histidine kinase (bacteriophytochrome)